MPKCTSIIFYITEQRKSTSWLVYMASIVRTWAASGFASAPGSFSASLMAWQRLLSAGHPA